MSDHELDDELAALGQSDSESEAGSPQHSHASKSRSPSAPRHSPGSSPRRSPPKALRGVAQRTTAKSGSRSRRMARDGSEDEGEASDASVNSLGSGAMSESETSAHEELSKEDDNMYPVDGKFKSQKEKAEILALPEIRREELLAERAQAVEESRLRNQLKARAAAQNKEEAKAQKRKAAQADLSESPRPSSKVKNDKSIALDALKEKRAARSEGRKAERTSNTDKLDKMFDEEDESEDESDEAPAATKLPSMPQNEPPATFDMYRQASSGRSLFSRICFTPGFEQAIEGGFVRVCVGPDPKASHRVLYKFRQIKEITTGKSYRMEAPNGKPFTTDQYAVLVLEKSDKKWPLNSCSDSKVTEPELDELVQTYKEAGKALCTPSFLQRMSANKHKLVNHAWTDAEISAKLRRGGLVQPIGEREKIEQERARAVEDGDEIAIMRCDQRLALFAPSKPASAVGRVNSSQDKLAMINRINRKANTENVRRAQLREKKEQQELLAKIARGEAAPNSMARVKTWAKTFHDSDDGKLGVPSDKDLFGDSRGNSRAGTPLAGGVSGTLTPLPGQKRAVSNKRKTDDEIMAEMDMDIDVEI